MPLQLPLEGNVCWVKHRPAAIWLPYQIDPRALALLQEALEQDASLADLPTELAAALALCGLEEPAADWDAVARVYRERRHASLPALLPTIWLRALQRYYFDLVAEGQLRWDHGKVNQLWAHDEPMGRVVHDQLKGLVSTISGGATKPSYSFLSCYKQGAEVAAHVDREQCEHSISMLIERRPEVALSEAWPLYVVEPDTRRRVGYRQGPGDAVMFKGRELPHYRKALTEADFSTSIFLHFVAETFAGDVR